MTSRLGADPELSTTRDWWLLDKAGAGAGGSGAAGSRPASRLGLSQKVDVCLEAATSLSLAVSHCISSREAHEDRE